MFKHSLPRYPGRIIAVLTVGLAMAAFFYGPPALGEDGEVPNQTVEVESSDDTALEAERVALLARAESLESLGHYLWTNNLSASQVRVRAYELRQLANLLVIEAERDLEAAKTSEERTAASARLAVIKDTSVILGEAADRISMTRGVRRKLRILALDLSRKAWLVFRRNELELPEDAPVIPGQLFKENEPSSAPSDRAYLEEPERDYISYSRGAVETDVLEARFFERVPRIPKPLPEEELYNKEGALTLSPLDSDYRSLRIWWSKPAEELAWVVEQW